MVMQSSGTIRASDIQGEFGGSNPFRLSDYYRGGGRVPNIAQNNSIPTSGTIRFSDFYGSTNATYNGFSFDFNFTQFGPPGVLNVYTNGTVSVTTGGTTHANGNWVNPTGTGVGNSYQIRTKLTNTGSWTSWATFTSNRSLGVAYSNPELSGRVDYQIRLTSGAVLVSSGSLTVRYV